MLKIKHDPIIKRISEVMLEVQQAEEFPIEIQVGDSTMKIDNVQEANIFSLGMLAAIDGKSIESDVENDE